MLKNYRYVLLWALFILVVCGVNGASLPKIKFRFAFGIDKIAHFTLFGTQAWLLLKAFLRTWYRKTITLALVAALLSSIYGVVIEILQATVFVNRSFDYEDMLANAVGACLCIPASLLLRKKT